MGSLTLSTRRYAITTGIAVAGLGCAEATPPTSPTHIEIVQGPPSAGVPNDYLIDTLQIRLVDEEGKPQSQQSVVWTIQRGGGVIVPLAAMTDALGLAAARWSLGAVGLNEVEVRTDLDSTVIFAANAEAFRVDVFDSNYGLACGLKSGDLWCWGQNSWVFNDPVSVGPSPFQYHFRAPGLMIAGQGFTNVAVGFAMVCATDPAGDVECFRQTGTVSPSVPPMRRIAGTNSGHFCGVATVDSTAWCWNLFTSTAGQVSASPQLIAIEMDAQLGEDYTACGLLADSTAACWGAGPLGDGTFNPSASPVPVSGGHKFVELAVGQDFGCGLESDGQVWCWGRNYDGQLGVTGPDSPVPVLVTDGVSRIAAAIRTVLALRFGTVVRWGFFGFDGGGHLLTPLASVSGLAVSEFSSNDISCLGLVDGQVYCFDEIHVNSSTVDIDRYTPVQPVVIP